MKDGVKNILKNSASRKAIFYILLYILGVTIVGFLLKQYVDREQLRILIDTAGTGGIFLFAFIEYLYTVFVPLNTTINLIAGYLFGGHIGWVLNFITTTAGLFTIIFLVKRFGRPLLEKIVSKKFLEKYDHLGKKIGPFLLFVVYIIPLTPDDELTYLIAATNIKFKRFILPVLFGNIAKATLSYVGDEGGAGLDLALGSRLAIFVVGGLAIGLQEYMVKRNQKNRVVN